jgi:hypothetical protein
MVRGRRLVHSMLLALWHSMQAQRGSALGNGTADEHSGTLMRACMERTSLSRWACQPLTYRRLVGSSLWQQGWPIISISVH